MQELSPKQFLEVVHMLGYFCCIFARHVMKIVVLFGFSSDKLYDASSNSNFYFYEYYPFYNLI